MSSWRSRRAHKLRQRDEIVSLLRNGGEYDLAMRLRRCKDDRCGIPLLCPWCGGRKSREIMKKFLAMVGMMDMLEKRKMWAINEVTELANFIRDQVSVDGSSEISQLIFSDVDRFHLLIQSLLGLEERGVVARLNSIQRVIELRGSIPDYLEWVLRFLEGVFRELKESRPAALRYYWRVYTLTIKPEQGSLETVMNGFANLWKRRLNLPGAGACG